MPEGFGRRCSGRVPVVPASSSNAAATAAVAPGGYRPRRRFGRDARSCDLRGYWHGRDIEWKRRLGLSDPASEAAGRRAPATGISAEPWREGLLASGRFAEFLPDDGEPVFGAELGEAILAYLARARARLMLVQIEDVAGADEQANLPGTTEAHPNWRRRLSARLEDVLAGAAMARVAALVTAARRLAAPGAAPE